MTAEHLPRERRPRADRQPLMRSWSILHDATSVQQSNSFANGARHSLFALYKTNIVKEPYSAPCSTLQPDGRGTSTLQGSW